MARGQRIDEATVDVELAWDNRAEAERANEAAEHAAATAVARLLSERRSVVDAVQPTGLDLPTVRSTWADRHPREQCWDGQ